MSVDPAGNLLFNNFSTGEVFELSTAGVTTAVVEADSGLNSWWLAVDGANNLFLTATRTKWPETQYPSIVFTETNDSHKKKSCATEGS